MRRIVRITLWTLLMVLTATAFVVRLTYGGGKPYSDLTTNAKLPDQALKTVVSYREPIGNVAVSASGRLFFTAHPEARPEGAKLLEWSDGGAQPFPNQAIQDEVFETPLGVVIDRQNRLWVIDHGGHGFGAPRLVAFDLATGAVVHNHEFAREAAPRGSFLQDLQVAPDGETVFVADVSFWRRQPAIVVHDVATSTDRRVLEDHESVAAQDWIIRTPTKRMVFFGGLAAMKPGIDGIAISPDGTWLTYGAMTHDTLFRVPTGALTDASLDDIGIAGQVEDLGRKPLSDGLSSDLEGGVWITDVEHGAVLRLTPSGALETWVKSPRIRWADALSFGPDGWLYVADSAIPDQVLRSRTHIKEEGPYFIYRFRPGVEGIPGH